MNDLLLTPEETRQAWGGDNFLSANMIRVEKAQLEKALKHKCPRCGGTGLVKGYAWRGIDRKRDLTTHLEPCPICRSEAVKQEGERIINVLLDFSNRKREPGHSTSYWAGYHHARSLVEQALKEKK